jgi:4-hydroxy-L-threonine phosphate dehydrogenase PdxA
MQVMKDLVGNEEETIIKLAIKDKKVMQPVYGPYKADAFCQPQQGSMRYFAMYHDQGLDTA